MHEQLSSEVSSLWLRAASQLCQHEEELGAERLKTYLWGSQWHFRGCLPSFCKGLKCAEVRLEKLEPSVQLSAAARELKEQLKMFRKRARDL